MRPFFTALLCAGLLLLPAAPAIAGPAPEKKLARREEARAAVGQILQGRGGVESAAARIEYLGEQSYASEVLIGALKDTFDEGSRRNIAHALSILAVKPAESALLRLTTEDDAVVRMYALQGLFRVKTRAADKIVPLLGDTSMPVRREAAKAIGQMAQPKTSKPLLKAVKSEGEPEVRAALLVAVGQSGDKRAINELEGFLTSSSESTRFAAARGLCLLGAPSGFKFARGLLSSKDSYERRHGLALFEGAPAKVISAEVRPLLQDADRRLAAIAARILYVGGDATMLDWLVLASYHSTGEVKLAIETELEKLHLADADRKAVLLRNGVGMATP